MAWDTLADEQREIRDLVRQLARERIAPRAAEIDESHEFPWDVVELYREHELFGLLFDESYGGLGTGTLLVLVAIEEVSKVCATSGLILAVQELGSLGPKLAGPEEQKERWPPRPARAPAWPPRDSASRRARPTTRCSTRRRARRWACRSRSTSSSRECSPTWRRSAKPPAACSTSSAAWSTRARRTTS